MGKWKQHQDGGSKKRPKYNSKDYTSREPALPYGKAGILITVDSGDFIKAGKEAVNVLNEIWEEIKPFKEAPAVAGTAEEAFAGKYSAREAAADKNSNEPDKQAEEQSEIAFSKEADAIVGAAVASPRSVAKEDKPQVQKDAMQDFGSLIADEVAALKDKKQHAFRFHDTGLKTIVFLEMPFATKDAGPCQVVKRLLQRAKRDKVLQFRFCARFLPCTHICKADSAAITEASKALVSEAFDSAVSPTPRARLYEKFISDPFSRHKNNAAGEPQTVAVLYEHRASPPDLKRLEVIDAVVESVPRPPHTVKLKGAKKTISVQVIRNACGMAVLDDYHDLEKYNIKSICAQKE